MKHSIKNSIKTVLFLAAVSLITVFFNACKTENIYSGEPYFKLENDSTSFTAPIGGQTISYVVRSNRPWKIIPQDTASWIKIFPSEGEDDGIFKIIVDKNSTFDVRMVDLAFIVNGNFQETLFHVWQGATVPYITISNADKGLSVLAAGQNFNAEVSSNVEWTYSLSDNSWLTVDSVKTTGIYFTAAKNTNTERTTTLTITSVQNPTLSAQVLITQLEGNILINEDFSWLNYGSPIPYNTTGETRYDSWTPEEQNHGWTSTPNSYSSNQPCTYARAGFVKLGKTNYGGDLISDKLTAIEGTVNLKVTFKAAAYISSGGTVDDKVLKVNALNAGISSVNEFIIDNIPNDQADDDAGIVNDIWANNRAYSFTITGATNETQIQFLGGDFNLKNIGQGKNRIFLDDIKVEIIP